MSELLTEWSLGTARGWFFGTGASVRARLRGAEGCIKTSFSQAEGSGETARAKAEVIAANSAVPSNAFEDPRSKVLTEAEEKKRAKRRAKRKKAKTTKKAAAAKDAHAGAGKEEGEPSSSDSDSSGPDDEEEGKDEEERMLARAPTFDLENEKAARKARAEAEKSKETKE
jgi:hypothetical protein